MDRHKGGSLGHGHFSGSHAGKSSTHHRVGAASAQLTRGISPSFQAKTGDLGIRNRGTLNSSFKRQAMTAHPPAQPGSSGAISGSHGASGNQDGGAQEVRPGSAPKMRTHTPNADSNINPTPSSLVLRSQPSTQSTAGGGGLNSSMSLSKQVDGSTTSASATSSKNMLNSFRNGPIK